MYCSRCNGLLLEGFLQIVLYGKSLQQEGVSKNQKDRGGSSIVTNNCQDEIQDPSVHPWGGLITARDGSLTLLDCYLYSKSLKGLKNVFDSARARERERELLYPDACGGGGRGWISQGIPSYGRGHGTRETCALHTARLSCDTLVDFWSALGEETRQSLLKMKEEDFIERLMYRFDSKRFCRDCRRNVIREFKELKELKRLKKEPHCTSWFCVANTDIQFEVSDDSIQADWRQKFADKIGSYHHFEWAVGSGEGKSDILEFENVGMNVSVHVDGLDLAGFSACYITLRAWKVDGRCSELSFKAHALKGQQCVHSRLVVGEGFVTMTRGESIRRFFEHAEEAEEEEDDDSMDKDGNELDGECSRPQKHAKSPELAREFLLDAATVIFKEQVEKAFREGTARQNAHSIFVCLALKLLEERVHVACKEIITLEKQDESSLSVDEEQCNSIGCTDSVSETGDHSLSRPESPDNHDEQLANEFASMESYPCDDYLDEEAKGDFTMGQSKFTRRSLKFVRRRNTAAAENGSLDIKSHSRAIDGSNRQLSRVNAPKSNGRNSMGMFNEKFQCFNCRSTEKYEFNSCSCNNPDYTYREKIDPHASGLRVGREFKPAFVKPKIRSMNGRDSVQSKKVWEPVESQKYARSNSDSDITLSLSKLSVEAGKNLDKSPADVCSSGNSGKLGEVDCVDNKMTKMTETCDPSTGYCPNGEGKDVSDPISSSSSNSDNCSSCLSEGDSNTASSNHGNLESSSTSDSEDTSQQSEGIQDGFSESPVGADKKQDKDILGTKASFELQQDCSPASIEVQTPPVKATPIPENGIRTANIEPQPCGMFPISPVHNQNIQYPIYQAPSSMGYYHQNPVSWPSGPANGLIPFAHSNHYMYASTIGYGMQYGAVPHLAAPVYNPSLVPVYQPLAKNNGFINKEEQIPSGHIGRLADKSAKMNIENNGFSLFHSGGPIALTTGCKSDLMPSKDGIVGGFSSQFSANHAEIGRACNKKENVARMFKKLDKAVSTDFGLDDTTTRTVGYVAPEYGLTWQEPTMHNPSKSND
ncbi:hypothetical protein ACFE04_029261 [Oxalis oulophora]